MFTYDEEIFSDLHKDAYGFRPRVHNFYESTPEEKQKIWDATIQDSNAAQEAEEARAADCVKDFKAEVKKVINEYGAKDRQQALSWIAEDLTNFYGPQEVEGWVYDRGMLFTDYGKELVKELMEIVQFGYNNRSKKNVW